MIRATAHREYNVLHLSFEGNVESRQFEELRRRLPAVLRCLGADFTLMTDLSGVEEFEFSCSGAIASLMEWIVEAGVSEVIRVVPDPRRDIGFAILAAFHYPSLLRVRVYTDVETAEAYLVRRPQHGVPGAEAYGCEEYLEASYPEGTRGVGV